MRISDWSSDVCSSDLIERQRITDRGKRQLVEIDGGRALQPGLITVGRNAAGGDAEIVVDAPVEHHARRLARDPLVPDAALIGQAIRRASCGESVCKYV